MEEEMVEDVNEEEVEYTFTAYEIDLDYEFDAARFFDFTHAESPLETRQAELWFESAGSYPPSPLLEKLVRREGIMMENINISPKSKGVESMSLSENNSDVEADREIPSMENYGVDRQNKGTSSSVHIASQRKLQNESQNFPSGLTFYNHMSNTVNSENQTKLSMKPTFPRTSTLMKPTASQLAKQNRTSQAGSRSHMSVFEKTSKSSANTCIVENQAAKRQKLEGGLLRKVMGTVQLQQTNFIHKAPKQDVFLDGNSTHTKLRITIPRDPDLETAQRAQRLRAKSSKDEKVTSTFRKFKARPLNRKILEAPSLLPKRSTPRLPDFQEFHLKTSERAMQHSSAMSKSTVPCNHSDKDFHKNTINLTADCVNREPGRGSHMNNASKPDGCQSSQSFKALPLNKKILSSKGDIGIFRNTKKETTVPMEFNFQSGKRFHDNPPIELFKNLSLASEPPVINSEPKVPWSIGISAKGSKENRWSSFQQENEIKKPSKLRLPLLDGKPQLSDELKNGVGISSGIHWGKPPMW